MCARSCIVLALTVGTVYAHKPVWVTIFLHGGGTHPMYFTVKDAFKIMKDNIDGSVYEKTTYLLRRDSYFSQVQGVQQLGLRKAFPVKKMDQHSGAQIFGKFYARVNDLAGFEPTIMYSFGWSSLLSPKARRAAARDFYKALVALVNHLRIQGFEPHLRVIGYSHGGNVTLYLAEVARSYKYVPFVIDEFIMVSTPVQPNTNQYLKSALFKDVYLFYSLGDKVQSSEFLTSSDHDWAHHFFLEKNNFELPKKVTQVQVRFIRNSITYKLKNGTSKTIYKPDLIQPNHTEMFFFGWTPEWYRKYFPIKPLPVAVFIPWMMRSLEKNHIHGGNVRITITPQNECMELFVPKTGQKTTSPFLSRSELNQLRNDMWTFRPDNMSEYFVRMRQRWGQAKEFVRAQFALRKH